MATPSSSLFRFHCRCALSASFLLIVRLAVAPLVQTIHQEGRASAALCCLCTSLCTLELNVSVVAKHHTPKRGRARSDGRRRGSRLPRTPRRRPARPPAPAHAAARSRTRWRPWRARAAGCWCWASCRARRTRRRRCASARHSAGPSPRTCCLARAWAPCTRALTPQGPPSCSTTSTTCCWTRRPAPLPRGAACAMMRPRPCAPRCDPMQCCSWAAA